MKNSPQETIESMDKIASKPYSEKEIAIFNGVILLAGGHKNMYAVTVQDIADSAGVGKGTIYDYFSSKEEIMIKTILYSVSLANQKTTERVEALSTFKEKVLAVYDTVMESVDNRLSAFNLTMSIGGISEVYAAAKDYSQEISKLSRQSEELFKKILTIGVVEKVILPILDKEYIAMAINSNIMAVGKAAMELCEKGDPKKIKDNAYKLLLKALN